MTSGFGCEAHRGRTTRSSIAVIRSCIMSSDIPAAMSWQRAGLPRRWALGNGPPAPDFWTSSRAVLFCQSGVWTAAVGEE